jgi:hypothetical protein
MSLRTHGVAAPITKSTEKQCCGITDKHKRGDCTKKRLFVDGTSSHIHVRYFVKSTTKLPKPLNQLSFESIYAYISCQKN